MPIDNTVEKYLSEAVTRGQAEKIVKYKGELMIKVKGMKELLGVGEAFWMPDGSGVDIKKINKNMKTVIVTDPVDKKQKSVKVTDLRYFDEDEY